MKTILRIAQLYAPFKRRLFVSFALLMVVELIGITTPYLYGQMIGAVSGHEISIVVWLGIGYALASFSEHVISWVRERFMLVFQVQSGTHLALHTLKKMLSYSIGQHHNENSGIKQQVVNRGEQAIREATSRTLFEFGPTLVSTIVSAIALLVFNWKVALFTIFGAAIYAVFTIRAHKSFIAAIHVIRKKGREADKLWGEVVRNVELVKVNAQEERAQAEYRRALVDNDQLELGTWAKVVNFWFSAKFILLTVTAVNLLACGIMVNVGMMTVGEMVTCLGWTSPILMRVTNLGNIQRNLMQWRVDIERYFTMMDVPCDVTIVENPVRPAAYRGEIRFENVSFAYPHHQWIDEEDGGEESETARLGDTKPAGNAISNVSLTFRTGERYAIVGRSGSGKSTLQQLILRSYDPQQGRVLVDGIDLRTLDLKHYLQRVGVVEQGVYLLDRSVRENVCWPRPAELPPLTDAELDDICRQACVDRFFDRLPRGIDTEIGERGVKLSGGERQRIGIARALAKSPALFLFDEATSQLDAVNEEDITSSIMNASRGKTTIIIAHRLSTILSADKIVVMDEGRVAGVGTHEELYEGCPQYRTLVEHQLRALDRLRLGHERSVPRPIGERRLVAV